MSIDKTAKAILALPEKGTFTHRRMIWQADWTDTDIATYAELKRMAKLWLMRDEIADAIKANDDLLAWYAPPTDAMAVAHQANTNLLVELGRRDGICLPSMYGEALEDNDERDKRELP